MIFAKGRLLPDSARKEVLEGLEEEINATRMGPRLERETVIAAVDALGKRLAGGEFDDLLRRFLPAGVTVEELLPLLRRETLEAKVEAELGPERREFAKTRARTEPLGTLFHMAAGNMPGLAVYTAVEGLLTGNVNLVKLPRGDKGLSLAAFSLLAEQEPRVAPYLYGFEIGAEDEVDIRFLMGLADGVAVWGGDGAIAAARRLAGPGCKLIEWGHRLGFCYVSGFEDRERELSGLAKHIIETGQRLCSSCQVIFLDSEDEEEGKRFCQEFLPYLERAAAQRQGVGRGAQASLSCQAALLERIAEGRTAGERLYRGRGCSVLFRGDRELELSPMEGNAVVKCLPQGELMGALRRQKGRVQTAGLICAKERREALTELLCRAGATRVTRGGSMSEAFPGEGHDGELPLRRYLRVVDVER